ncbi:MAG: type IX secretion system sortase PorU [Flavobacteriales bacterium]
MLQRLLILLISLLTIVTSAQEKQFFWVDWDNNDSSLVINESDDLLVRLEYQFDNNHTYEVVLSSMIFENCSEEQSDLVNLNKLDHTPKLTVKQGVERKKSKVLLEIFPLVIQNGQLKKLIYAQLNFHSVPFISKRSSSANNESILSSGNWYKIAVNENGVYKMTYDHLQTLGVDVEFINPNNIALFGKPGGMLPINSNEIRYNGLSQLAIEVVDGGDNSFDQNDYLIFYGQNPDQWKYDIDNNQFNFHKHLYDNNSYYFLTVLNEPGKRIVNVPSNQNPSVNIDTFEDFAVHEQDDYNFVQSGRTWYGDKFGSINNRSYNFNFPNLISQVDLKIDFAARVPTPYSNYFTVSANGLSDQVVNINPVSGSYTYAYEKTLESSFTPTSSNVNLSISYSSNYSGAEGYIDKIELFGKRQLRLVGNQMNFRSTFSVSEDQVSSFTLSNSNSLTSVWDVTDPLNVANRLGDLTGSQFVFSTVTDTLREFIAFNNFKSVQLLGSIENQNLHDLDNVDFVIVSHPLFLEQANRLADIHRINDKLRVVVVTPQQIYNEFSSGSQDVSAIRDFAKMLYDKEESSFQYMLLFGDASYDPKSRISNNTNYIISYQSENSKSFIDSYVSDDFFAILDDNESILQSSNSMPFLDIGVGRFPVSTIEQAQIVVDKVEDYYSAQSFGDWRLKMSFVGDDNDVVETVHTNQAEELADLVSNQNPMVNIDKLYLDSYSQVSSAGGQRCPDINKAINEAMTKGTFLVNYTGHGGELGWAHERILEVSDINSWNNKNKLPIFMTATCEFSRYDDPERISAGEQVFLKENGGAIALLTTSRVVFTGSNFNMNESFFNHLFPTSDGPRRLGDVIMATKNNVANISSTNHRNFTLLGNPALKLSFPELEIVLTEVQDSAKALGKVTLRGEVRRNGQIVEDFNGLLNTTVFDKKTDYQTLQQDESPLITFDLQKNVLFRGSSSVTNGTFSINFVVPRDLNYDFGNAKVSLYAYGSTYEDSIIDGAGFNLDMVVGGTEDNYMEDIDGPNIQLFMDNTDFESGDITNENPSLLAILFDQNGINTTGNGIGHDVTAILDEETANPIVLNDFYQSDVDSYQSGKIIYPFNLLNEGTHRLKVKVWDVYNNSSEDELEFRVVKSSNLTIQNLINYPNPVVDYTEFYFDHNQNGKELKIELKISDMQGRSVFNHKKNVYPSENKYGPITWNAKSNRSSDLSQGVYVYTLIATASNGEVMQKSGRLILLD